MRNELVQVATANGKPWMWYGKRQYEKYKYFISLRADFGARLGCVSLWQWRRFFNISSLHFFRLGAQPWNSNKRECNVSPVRVFFFFVFVFVLPAMFFMLHFSLFFRLFFLFEFSNIDRASKMDSSKRSNRQTVVYYTTHSHGLCADIGKGHAATLKVKEARTKALLCAVWPREDAKECSRRAENLRSLKLQVEKREN